MSGDYLFSSRNRSSSHISTRQYARLVDQWFQGIGIGLDPAEYGTHSMGRTKMESTITYLGIEVEDALEMAAQTEIWPVIALGRSQGRFRVAPKEAMIQASQLAANDQNRLLH